MVTNAADLGEVRAAADILGHSPEMLMKTYSHVLPESIRTVTNKIGCRHQRGLPLIRAPRTLPRVLNPGEVDALVAALRTRRDRAMVDAMLLGGCAAARSSGYG